MIYELYAEAKTAADFKRLLEELSFPTHSKHDEAIGICGGNYDNRGKRFNPLVAKIFVRGSPESVPDEVLEYISHLANIERITRNDQELWPNGKKTDNRAA